MRKIRVGLIGGGFMGRVHTEALRRLGWVEVMALAKRKRARERADELNIPLAYQDYRDLIRSDEVEVVHILTPNVLHYPMAKMCIEQGKHIVCEKPLTVNSKESAELVRMVKEKGLVNVVCYNMRYYPLVKEAKALVESNEIGSIRLVHGAYLQDWLFYDTDYDWRVEANLGGKSRAVADIGSHWLDMVQHITNQSVVSVFADLTTFLPYRKRPKREVATSAERKLDPEDCEEVKIDTEDHATVLLRFDRGAKGVFIVSQVSAGRKNMIHFEINGSKKSIAWNGERPNEMWIGERGSINGQFLKDPALMSEETREYASVPGGAAEGYPDTFKNLFHKVYTWIAEGCVPTDREPPFPTFLDGHREILIVDAVLKSQSEGEWVKVGRPS